jgi:hypothetical protein
LRISASEIADAYWHQKTVTVTTIDGSNHVGKVRSYDKRYICIRSEVETMWVPVEDIISIDLD